MNTLTKHNWERGAPRYPTFQDMRWITTDLNYPISIVIEKEKGPDPRERQVVLRRSPNDNETLSEGMTMTEAISYVVENVGVPSP